MTDDDRRENSARLKAVEEAVIEFRFIAEKIVVSHANKLDEHDKAISEIRSTIYLSCDAKTQEVDIKIEKSETIMIDAIKASETRLTDMANKYFSYGVWVISGVIGLIGILCTLGVMWISYSNNQINGLGDKINIRENVSVKNRENILSTQHEVLSTQQNVGHLRNEVKEVQDDIHEILSKLVRIK